MNFIPIQHLKSASNLIAGKKDLITSLNLESDIIDIELEIDKADLFDAS